MRAVTIGVLALSCACSTSPSASDAGADATTDSGIDICDIDAYFDAGGAGHRCPFASPALCFHNMTDCPLQGCKCVATPMGPTWQCTTDLSCKDTGTDDADTGDASSDSPTD